MYDLIVLGGGPGGYRAGLRAKKIGKSVLIIEKDRIGGTCLHRGCIPTKSLLNSSKRYTEALEQHKKGVKYENVEFIWRDALKWKDSVVNKLYTDLKKLIESKKIDIIKGEGELIDSNTVAVDGTIYKGANIIIATGSSPITPNIPGIEHTITSRHILNIQSIPESLTIIGGGVIGLEFASLFSSIGTKVTIIEIEERVLPKIDRRVVNELKKSLNVDFKCKAEVTKITKSSVFYLCGNIEKELESDLILNATGRRGNIDCLKDPALVRDGKLVVDNYLETNLKGVYGIGDVTNISLLAHSATYMADLAVDNIYGNRREYDLTNIPQVVYTYPEVASVGLSSDEAKSLGFQVIKKSYKLTHNGRYYTEHGDDSGLCLVLVNRDSRELVGLHLIGKGVSEVLSIGSLAIKNKLTLDDFAKTVFPHPTLSEVIRDTMDFIG